MKFIMAKLNEKLHKEPILTELGDGSHVEGNNKDTHPDRKDQLGDTFSHEELSLLIVKNKNLEDTTFCDLGKISYDMFHSESTQVLLHLCLGVLWL